MVKIRLQSLSQGKQIPLGNLLVHIFFAKHSPIVDYSQHGEIILQLDQALEEGAYISFAYTPLL